MNQFMDKDFLLQTETAKTLFHNYAKDMPIFDYHSHLNAKEIFDDKQFSSITEAWLGFDHYKWRALRTNGISESFITGDKSDKEKFEKWSETMPYLIGNPLYHWTHLELQRYFNIYEPLSPETADDIYNKCNEDLKKKEFSVRSLIKKSNVFALCTTDDPIDDLKYHIALKNENFEAKVLPTYRPDCAVDIEKSGFESYIAKLGEAVGYQLNSIEDLEKALIERLYFFNEAGSRLSDHGLDEVLYLESTKEEANEIYLKGLKKEALAKDEIRKYKGYLINCLAKEYHKLGWVMQLHIGAVRNNSTRKFNSIGANVGCDSINDSETAKDLSRLLDSLDRTNQLPKTVLYCLNPKDNEVLASMAGNFQDEGIAGKIQFGSGWWFNDQLDGIKRQLEALSQIGMVSKFIGMLTDSRSFLSFPRHEYFRRILCNQFGDLIESGQYPNDTKLVGKIVEDICFNNIKKYIDID